VKIKVKFKYYKNYNIFKTIKKTYKLYKAIYNISILKGRILIILIYIIIIIKDLI
jgi:hypothetical protein